jgi:hypothetical protein
MQSNRRMRAWTSPDFRRRLSVAERSFTTTARLWERQAPDASFPAVNFNGRRFVPSATKRRIAVLVLAPLRRRCGPGRRLRWSGTQFQQGLSCRSGHDAPAAHVDAGSREGPIRLLGGGGGRDGGTRFQLAPVGDLQTRNRHVWADDELFL